MGSKLDAALNAALDKLMAGGDEQPDDNADSRPALDLHQAVDWSFAVALTWIMTRDNAALSDVSQERAPLDGLSARGVNLKMLDPSAMNYEDAREALIRALCEGRLTGAALRGDELLELKPREWQHWKISSDPISGGIRLHHDKTGSVLLHPSLRRDEVVAAWPPPEAISVLDGTHSTLGCADEDDGEGVGLMLPMLHVYQALVAAFGPRGGARLMRTTDRAEAAEKYRLQLNPRPLFPKDLKGAIRKLDKLIFEPGKTGIDKRSMKK